MVDFLLLLGIACVGAFIGLMLPVPGQSGATVGNRSSLLDVFN